MADDFGQDFLNAYFQTVGNSQKMRLAQQQFGMQQAELAFRQQELQQRQKEHTDNIAQQANVLQFEKDREKREAASASARESFEALGLLGSGKAEAIQPGQQTPIPMPSGNVQPIPTEKMPGVFSFAGTKLRAIPLDEQQASANQRAIALQEDSKRRLEQSFKDIEAKHPGFMTDELKLKLELFGRGGSDALKIFSPDKFMNPDEMFSMHVLNPIAQASDSWVKNKYKGDYIKAMADKDLTNPLRKLISVVNEHKAAGAMVVNAGQQARENTANNDYAEINLEFGKKLDQLGDAAKKLGPEEATKLFETTENEINQRRRALKLPVLDHKAASQAASLVLRSHPKTTGKFAALGDLANLIGK